MHLTSRAVAPSSCKGLGRTRQVPACRPATRSRLLRPVLCLSAAARPVHPQVRPQTAPRRVESAAAAVEMMAAAFDAGVNFFDNAEAYRRAGRHGGAAGAGLGGAQPARHLGYHGCVRPAATPVQAGRAGAAGQADAPSCWRASARSPARWPTDRHGSPFPGPGAARRGGAIRRCAIVRRRHSVMHRWSVPPPTARVSGACRACGSSAANRPQRPIFHRLFVP